ncbi:MAG: TonB-dependent receptor [Pseudomonadales bacterium]
MYTAVIRRGGSYLAAALILPFYSLPVDAQEATGRRIEEVIVTAERREASIQDTSISITAFTAEFLDDFGIRNQEDLQNFVPATTIQPYDATVRGVGRNFRALGGDPGVSTYMNGIYSEDLLTATAATFFDVERIEVLRGPQGTLYGRNAVGGAINILYKEPSYTREGMVKAIAGNFGTEEYYAAFSGPLIADKLAGRVTYAHRERDGVVDEIGIGSDIDGLGTDSLALQLKWNITDNIEMNIRQNWMDIDRSFGGANGAGLVTLNESGEPRRVTGTGIMGDGLVPGWRFVDQAKVLDATNQFDTDVFVPGATQRMFTDPSTGAQMLAQRNRPGIDFGDFDGFQNAAASLDGYGVTSPEKAALYNGCVFSGSIDGDDVCAATNGLNNEEFEQMGTQFNIGWDVTENLTVKYLFGFNTLSYERITDDDNTASLIHDRQFYVNHEADYRSHELQAFFDVGENWTFTSGIFFYNAEIDQRGDFYSSLGEAKFRDAYIDNTALSAGAAAAIGAPGLEGINASTLAFAGRPMANLYSAKRSCTLSDNPAPSCARNYAVQFTNEELAAAGMGRNDNLYTSAWYGDPGTDRLLDVRNGPRTVATDLLYTTETKREAFAAYTQSVWDINETFALTLGLRYAEDKVVAEENLFRYSETGGDGFLALYGGVAAVNIVNGGLVDSDSDGIYEPTQASTNGGIPFGLSVYRPFERTDKEWDWRVNLDHHITDNVMLYYSATKGHRGGGYNLVFFSATPTYDPEKLISYELGYKSDWLDGRLQLNGSFYYYDYESIHSVVQEVTSLGGTSNSVLEAPGAEVIGVEAEFTWLATDALTLGGNFSYTPSEYTKSLLAGDLAGVDRPTSLFPDQEDLLKDIKGNQLLQVPEWKGTLWGSYRFNLPGGSHIDTLAAWAYTDKVYYTPFEAEQESAASYDRTDVRATWVSADSRITVSAFVNNVFDEVGNLQVLSEGEDEFFRRSSGTTVPRLFGLELSYTMGTY